MSEGNPGDRTSGAGTRGGYGADDPERDSDSGANPADDQRRDDENEGEAGASNEGSQSTGHPDNAG